MTTVSPAPSKKTCLSSKHVLFDCKQGLSRCCKSSLKRTQAVAGQPSPSVRGCLWMLETSSHVCPLSFPLHPCAPAPAAAALQGRSWALLGEYVSFILCWHIHPCWSHWAEQGAFPADGASESAELQPGQDPAPHARLSGLAASGTGFPRLEISAPPASAAP